MRQVRASVSDLATGWPENFRNTLSIVLNRREFDLPDLCREISAALRVLDLLVDRAKREKPRWKLILRFTRCVAVTSFPAAAKFTSRNFVRLPLASFRRKSSSSSVDVSIGPAARMRTRTLFGSSLTRPGVTTGRSSAKRRAMLTVLFSSGAAFGCQLNVVNVPGACLVDTHGSRSRVSPGALTSFARTPRKKAGAGHRLGGVGR